MSAYSGNVVVPPDGEPVELPFPADEVFSVTRVPGGGVVEAGSGLWWVPDTGEPTLLGTVSTPVFRADGSALVATASDGSGTVVALALPSLIELGRTRFETALGPIVVGVAGDWVLLRGAQGGPGPSESAVWNLATGALTPTEEDTVWAWDLAADGYVLRRVDEPGAAPREIASACIDVVEISAPLTAGDSGLCGDPAQFLYGGDLSPDGRWAYLSSGDPEFPGRFLLATADLRAGRWGPVELDPAIGVLVYWDTDETFIAGDALGSWHRCDTTGACERLALPAGLVDPRIAPSHG